MQNASSTEINFQTVNDNLPPRHSARSRRLSGDENYHPIEPRPQRAREREGKQSDNPVFHHLNYFVCTLAAAKWNPKTYLEEDWIPPCGAG